MLLFSMKNLHHVFFFLLIVISSSLIFVSDEVRTVVFQFAKIDTIGHFIGFFCLTWLLSSILQLPLVNLTFCLIVYSALTEIGQYYLGFRNGEFRDFVADALGILTFMLIKWVVVVYGRKQTI
jgi:VanZ family protein